MTTNVKQVKFVKEVASIDDAVREVVIYQESRRRAESDKGRRHRSINMVRPTEEDEDDGRLAGINRNKEHRVLTPEPGARLTRVSKKYWQKFNRTLARYRVKCLAQHKYLRCKPATRDWRTESRCWSRRPLQLYRGVKGSQGIQL